MLFQPAKKRIALLQSPEMADEDEAMVREEVNNLSCDVEKWTFLTSCVARGSEPTCAGARWCPRK